ncbi:MAG: coenzyme F420-0:L-glutamate ligase [Ktedonobacteraceae bacterium]|jgi:coenzyme F420-0:L-glutamate ligase / coenzyme F420-1:gamma-L-glutamate ligase
MSTELRIIPVTGIGEISPGIDLGDVIYTALQGQQLELQRRDILVVTQKIVSKAEGRLVDLSEIQPSPFASIVAGQSKKDARHIEVVLRESRRVVRMDHGVLITETNHGFICANSGVDESNVKGSDELTLLPQDPDHSARLLRSRLKELARKDSAFDLAVIISDTWGRPWRNGQVNMAIGVAGMETIVDYRGQRDPYGYELQASAIAVADELAAAAELVMGKIDRIPVALIRGYAYITSSGDAKALLRDTATDMFR